MKFTRKKFLKEIKTNKEHRGFIYDINKVSIKKGDYYDVKIEIPEGIISIWVSDDVNPEHPMFEIFDSYIDNDEEAENFNEKDIIGCPVKFKLKLIKLTDTSHYFFEYIQINEEEIE